MDTEQALNKAKEKNYKVRFYNDKEEVKEGEPFTRLSFNVNKGNAYRYYWYDAKDSTILFSHIYSITSAKINSNFAEATKFERKLLS